MLAKFFRRVIFAQFLIGAALGYLLAAFNQWPKWSIWIIAASLPLLILILAVVVTALKSRPPEPLPMWWRSLFGEFVTWIQIFSLRLPWTISPPGVLPATGSAAKVPVVLVHGYLCNHRVWDDMAEALRADGHAVFAVDLEPVFSSIDLYAPIIETAVSELCRLTGTTKVALVGHSMGGLAIRAWIRTHGTQRVARVLTLGTPHAGTQIARNHRTPNGQQMNWRSPWLEELASGESDSIRALIGIAITPHDNIVYPQREQVLHGVEPTVFEGIGHVQMCLHKPVIDWVLLQLSAIDQN